MRVYVVQGPPASQRLTVVVEESILGLGQCGHLVSTFIRGGREGGEGREWKQSRP
jgi:hypothetical protein